MQKKMIIISIFLLIILISNFPSKIIVAASDPWPPFVDSENPNDGLSLEIIRAAYATQGYEVKTEYVPWARAETGVKEGFYDIIPNTWLTTKRTEYLYYSQPYLFNNIKFIKLKDDEFEYEDLESLNEKVVGVIRGYGYGDAFLNDENFIRDDANDLITNIRKLLIGRIDLTLEDEIVARIILEREDPTLLDQIEFVKKPLSVQALYITSGYSNPRHIEFIDAFNKGLEIIINNGTYDKILENYGIN